ncbi:MAG: hypothetical protein JSS02_07640 [Planctomycetes bacterium]|nr:hypothetical protein [Planctomycetota bacterium]
MVKAEEAVATWEDLQVLVISLQGLQELRERRCVAGEIVVQGRFDAMLTATCGVVLRGQARNDALFEDVRQEAVTILLERFGVGNLAYVNEGCDRFRHWVYTIGRCACVDACVRLRRSCSRLTFVDNAFLDRYAQKSDPSPCDRQMQVLIAIDGIDDLLLRNLLLETCYGWTLERSAANHDLSSGQVFRLRGKARQILRSRIGD